MSDKLTYWIAAAGREYTYEPMTDAELGLALVESAENLADPKNRSWGVDVLVLRLIDRLTTAEAKVIALREEIERIDAMRANFVADMDAAITTLRHELVAKVEV